MKKLLFLVSLLFSVAAMAQQPLQDEHGQYYEPFRSNMQIQKDLAVFGNRVAFIDPSVSVAIGDTAGEVASSILTIESDSKGVLLPRMTAAERLAIDNPATGLLVFDTDSTYHMYYNGGAWIGVYGYGGTSYFNRSGNYLYPNTIGDSIGIGTSTPTSTLDVQGTFQAVDGDSAQFKLGLTTFPFFDGAVNVLFHGAVAQKTFGDWHYLSSSASNSVAESITSEITAINYVNGNYRAVAVDSSEARIELGNVTNSPGEFNQIIINDTTIFFNSSNNVGYNRIGFSVNGNLLLKLDSLLRYEDGNQANGYILTSDANGAASWQAPQIRTLHQDTGATTTGTTWETLGTYTIAANTLSDESSLDISLWHTGVEVSDSLLLLFGTDTVFSVRNSGNNYDEIVSRVFQISGSNQTLFSAFNADADRLKNGTQNPAAPIDVTFKAKSATAGNQKLEFFRITYFE